MTGCCMQQPLHSGQLMTPLPEIALLDAFSSTSCMLAPSSPSAPHAVGNGPVRLLCETSTLTGTLSVAQLLSRAPVSRLLDRLRVCSWLLTVQLSMDRLPCRELPASDSRLTLQQSKQHLVSALDATLLMFQHVQVQRETQA